MKFITVREFRSSTAKMWRKLRKERQLVVTRHGKPVAMVTATNEKEIGQALLKEQGRKALAALDRIHADVKARGLPPLSMSQIDEIIAQARKERRLRQP